MPKRERGRCLAACLLALLLAGCGPAVTASLPSATVLPAHATGLLPSPTVPPAHATGTLPSPTAPPPTATAEPAADPATSPLPTAGAAREAVQLVVLHSNDNWGETEPCG